MTSGRLPQLPRWSEITAYFGGAFDPPHLGHREAIVGLLANPGVRSVRVIPTGNPALKTAQTSAEHRLAMARIAFARVAEIDDREIRRPPAVPSYTFDTLTELRAEFGPTTAFVVGVDQIENLDRWNRFPEVLGLTNWIALERAPGGADRMERALARLAMFGALENTSDPRLWRVRAGGGNTFIYRVATPAREVSSTEIRRDFARATSEVATIPTASLDPNVAAYIRRNGLYGGLAESP